MNLSRLEAWKDSNLCRLGSFVATTNVHVVVFVVFELPIPLLVKVPTIIGDGMCSDRCKRQDPPYAISPVGWLQPR